MEMREQGLVQVANGDYYRILRTIPNGCPGLDLGGVPISISFQLITDYVDPVRAKTQIFEIHEFQGVLAGSGYSDKGIRKYDRVQLANGDTFKVISGSQDQGHNKGYMSSVRIRIAEGLSVYVHEAFVTKIT
jgi:hypothetical protein